MIGSKDLEWLIDQTGQYRLKCGWFLVIRAEWCDVTVGRPNGIFYGLLLQDQDRRRILGFDNSHAFDGAKSGDPFDHEHKAGKVGQRFPYTFRDTGELFRDFMDRVQCYCDQKDVPFEIEE